MEPVRLMLVGCGMMGARHLRGYGELERVKPGTVDLVGVCDLDPGLAHPVADEAAELLGTRPQVHTDLDAGLSTDGLEAVDIVTPNRTHDDVAVRVLGAGLHVLLEKPFAVTIPRGRRILDAAAEAGTVLATAENNRRDPMNRLARHVVQSGLIGDVNHVSVTQLTRGGKVCGTPWRHLLGMGGIPLDVWIHLGYVLESIAGQVKTVSASGGMVESDREWRQPDGTPERVPCDSPDHINAMLVFENGASGTWTTHFASPSTTRSEHLVVGAKGVLLPSASRSGRAVRVELGDTVLEGDALVEALPAWRLSELEAALFGQRPASYQFDGRETDRKLIAAEVGDFADAIRKARPPETPGDVGLRSVAIILSLLESMQCGAPVHVSDVLAGAPHEAQDRIEAWRPKE